MQPDWTKHEYINLSTQKRDGSWVETPVWFAYNADDHCLYCFSEGKAGKVKRIRNFSQVKITPCGVTGKHKGNWQDAEAQLLSTSSDIDIAYTTLLRRYGLKMRALNVLARIGKKINKRAFIRIKL